MTRNEHKESVDQLDAFNAALKGGITVAEFLGTYRQVMEFVHAAGLIGKFRLAADPLKKLRAEVAPVVRFARCHVAPEDRIQFPLNDSVPDCNVWHGDGRHRLIEVTAMQGMERFHTMTELNETGCGRGHTGLTDDRSAKDFHREMDQERRMFSTAEIEETYVRGFEIAVNRKLNNTGADTLLIDGPPDTLSEDRWHAMRPMLTAVVKNHPHRDIFVVAIGGEGPCLQIK